MLKVSRNILLVFLTVSICNFSCSKKLDISIPINSGNSQFFSLRSNLSEPAARIYRIIQSANEKNHCIENLPINAGTPIWEKILLPGKTESYNQNAKRVNGIGTNQSISIDEVIVIPMTIDDKYLSSLIIGTISNDSTVSLNCITNDSLQRLVYNPLNDKNR